MDDVVIPGTANPQRNSQIDPQVASYSSCTYSVGETLANSYLSQFHEVHNDDVFIENGANELNDNIIYDSEVHNNDVIIEDSECHDNVIDNTAINHFNRNFSEHSSASENENIKQIDITCEDKPEETFQNEQNVADNIYDTEYEYLRHNLIDNTITVLSNEIESHDENLHNEVDALTYR